MRAVLWDMDGTLVDSEEYHWISWRDTMARRGFALTHERVLETFGWRNDAILAGWLGETATPDVVREIGDEKEALYRDLVRRHGLSPLPGAEPWVRRLKADGWRQAIASSAPRANVETILEVLGFDGLFDALVSAEDVRNGKPAPDVFLAAAAKVGVDPSGCIVVEDAVAGVEAGRRAGMPTIGVANRGQQLQASLVVTSLTDLPPNTFDALLP
jgi:HAD superfamily hydrolase (TIGR01509 family)